MPRSNLIPYPISPLTGPLDTRSLPNQIAKTGVRWRQNKRTDERGRLFRGPGWAKFRDGTPYNNADLHDQLLNFIPSGHRQPVIFMGEYESSRKVRRFFAANQNAIYRYNEYTQNWAVLGSGYGAGSTSANDYRWKVSQLGDYLILTNGYNKVLFHTMEEASIGDPLLQTLPDLDTIALTRASVTWSWRNCIFLADVDMDGDRFAYRLLWSDYQNPTSFDPSIVSSITGSKDLFQYETILGGAPAGNSFLIYTTHGIWEMTAVGGATSFAWRRIYNGDDDQSMCLKYPNTLVNLGDSHAYMAKQRVMLFSAYYQEPTAVPWLDMASGALYQPIEGHYNAIDDQACNSHVGFYDGDELYFSVAKIGDANQCPSLTLRANKRFQVADYIDHGFTCFAHNRPGGFQTVRDFILDNEICTPAGLQSLGYWFTNEGLPNPFPPTTAAFVPQSIYTRHPLTVAGVTTEDYTRPQGDSDSLCALLGSERFDDICRKCDGIPLVVAVSSDDWCLKELNNVWYRERCTNPTAVGTAGSLGYTSSTGLYVLDPYDSITRFAPGMQADANTRCRKLKVDYVAVFQEAPAFLQLRVGLSGQIADPNTDDCRLVWRTLSLKPMKCLSPSAVADHLKNNTTPNLYTHWDFDYTAKYVYLELKIGGTGAQCFFSGVEGIFEPVSTRNYQ